MMYAIMFSSFILGFASCLLIISKVTFRPKVRRVLNRVKIISKHRAKVPVVIDKKPYIEVI